MRKVLNNQLPLYLSATSHQFSFFIGSQNRFHILIWWDNHSGGMDMFFLTDKRRLVHKLAYCSDCVHGRRTSSIDLMNENYFQNVYSSWCCLNVVWWNLKLCIYENLFEALFENMHWIILCCCIYVLSNIQYLLCCWNGQSP